MLTEDVQVLSFLNELPMDQWDDSAAGGSHAAPLRYAALSAITAPALLSISEPRWSQSAVACRQQASDAAHSRDEYDVEYDRGKQRKRPLHAENPLSKGNPFQKMAQKSPKRKRR